jgi:uncharacterized protein with HEPN domain
MVRSDWHRVRHMVDAIREAQGFVAARSRADLDEDRMLALALVKSIEIIGEAATNITRETRDEHPEIPWRRIIGMRNRLIHAYFDVDLDRVWDTLTSDLPPLLAALEPLFLAEPPRPERAAAPLEVTEDE